MKKLSLLVSLTVLLSIIAYGQSNTETLETLLNRINDIKAASFNLKSSSSAPGDTLAFRTFEKYMQMYINPVDTITGARYFVSGINTKSEYEICYDGRYSVRLNWDKRTARVDTVSGELYSRPSSPFFIKVRALLEYSISNPDSTNIQCSEYGDSSKISFVFNNKYIEFLFLQPMIKHQEGMKSRYEVWLDKNRMPYKMIRRVPHQTSFVTISDLIVEDISDDEFDALKQIPIGFKIRGRENTKVTTGELEGQLASDWILKEIDGDSIALKDLKGKVVLLQFTGIGCGPCHASIPFLKTLAEDYKDKDFELLCIETWSKNISGIERYKAKNELNYPFLVGNTNLKENYKIQGVPAFFILDENRIIKKVNVGYKKGETEKTIIESIDALL